MISIPFTDRHGSIDSIPVHNGQTIRSALLSEKIPPTSVLVLEDDRPVSSDITVNNNCEYEIVLLEGYRLQSIKDELSLSQNHNYYTNTRLGFGKDGGLELSEDEYNLEGFQVYLEEALLGSIQHYDLITEGDSIILGISGGLDSSILLRMLSNIRDNLPDFELTATTVENFIPVEDDQLIENIADKVDALGFNHHCVSCDGISKIYNLNCTPREALERIESTHFATELGTIAPSIIQRMIQKTAIDGGYDSVFLGGHATELIGGILNSWFTGAEIDRKPIPQHSLNELSYCYPLAHITKQELALYRYADTGVTYVEREQNPWDWFSDEQNFFYYFSDMIQSIWPGVDYWLYASHNNRIKEPKTISWKCVNCGKLKELEGNSSYAECLVCRALREADCI